MCIRDRLKPSPFCLLDEIEAALDDSNVSRYANYLNKLTKNTQFIVITHRRGTMAAADRLYGITMQMCIRDSTIAEEGTPEEGFGAPKSERLQEFLSRVL